MTEDDLTSWLGRQPQTKGFLGNDAAILSKGGPFAVTVDSQRAGVHFPLDLEVSHFARRLLAVNLSDLAACGAKPGFAFLALSAPPSFDHKKFFRAFLKEAQRVGLVLAGGDLSSNKTPEASLTLMGTPWPKGSFLKRCTARAGDQLWVGGSVGESALGLELTLRGARLKGAGVKLSPRLEKGLARSPKGLVIAAKKAVKRHLLPSPQLELGRWLSNQKQPIAAIDLSDGLAKDAARLARASGTGIRLEAQALPTPPRNGERGQFLGKDLRAVQLSGGEDYVLAFTLPKGVKPPPRFACTRIGFLTRSTERTLQDADESLHPLEPFERLSWDHL